METRTTPVSQLDVFFYAVPDCDGEDLLEYKPGGLHPIILGDTLPKSSSCVSDPAKQPRYRIMLKLGFGAFATVWLARDLVEGRYVAVKIVKGSDTPSRSREAIILSQLAQIRNESVVRLFDDFIIKGPNGYHECLVMEPVAPLSDIDIKADCSSTIIRQVVEGFAFLHGQGITHGDPHFANLGVPLPQLDKFEEEDIFDHFSDPDYIPVIPRDHTLPTHSLPPYIPPKGDLYYYLTTKKAFHNTSQLPIRLLDFGRSNQINQQQPSLAGAVPIYARPPEVIIYELSNGQEGTMWSKEADVWAVGITLYYILRRDELLSTWGSLDDFLLRSAQYGGSAPKPWLKYMSLSDEQNKKLDSDRDAVWKKAASDRNWTVPAFFEMLKRIIVTDPAQRCSMRELLGDPYFDN